MALGERGNGKIGLQLNCPEDLSKEAFLFSESGGFVIEVSQENLDSVMAIATDLSVEAIPIGFTKSVPIMTVSSQDEPLFELPLTAMKSAWDQQNNLDPGTAT